MNYYQNCKNFILLREILSTQSAELDEIISSAHIHNKWFIPSFSRYAFQQIINHYLHPNVLTNLPQKYPYLLDTKTPKTIGVLVSGNIPFAGFFDLLCVLLSGHKLHIKCSQKDRILMAYVIQQLLNIDQQYQDYIDIVEQLKNSDAFIGSGSNQTINLIKQYVQTKPHLLRGHKTSLAIISGKETSLELEQLSDDIFLYFGQGCRSITTLLLPNGYQVEQLIHHWKKYEHLKEHYHYKQNVDYQYALVLLNKMEHYFGDFILLRKNDDLNTPLGCLDYTFYESESQLNHILNQHKYQLQCIVGKGFKDFGTAQQPDFFDYPDGQDVMNFLGTMTESLKKI